MKFWLGREHMRYCLWEGDEPPVYLGDVHGFNTPPENEQKGHVADVHVSQAERLFGVKLELGQMCELDATFRVLECSDSVSGSGR